MKLKYIGKKILTVLLVLTLLLQAMTVGSIVSAASDWTGYIAISNKSELNNVRNNLLGKYYLMADIVFTSSDFESGGAFYNGGAGWQPIGTGGSSAFTGIFDGNGHTISGLYCNIVLSTADVYAGLFGYNQGTIKNFGMVDGNINSTSSSWLSSNAGGIVGFNSGIITNCYNTGSVSSTSSLYHAYAGGIAGRNSKTISNCYNTGNVNAPFAFGAYSGGIVGLNLETISSCYNTGIVNASFSEAGTYPGGIVGCNSYGTINNCYYLNIISKGVGDDSGATTTLTFNQMKQQLSFDGFDFTNVWQIDNAASYQFPRLKNVEHVEKLENKTDFNGGNGSTYNPYQISTKEQLNRLRNDLTSCYILKSDIEFTSSDFALGGALFNKGAGWQPIGTGESNAFTGIFDGNGHTISGLYCNIASSTAVYAGLLGCNKGIIKNLGMIDGNINAKSTSTSPTFAIYAGGIVGLSSFGTITNCYSTSNVSLSSSSYNAYAGGIAGCNSSSITNCYNTGNVNASPTTGGIAGFNSGIISNCYNTGSISATIKAGGIVGYNSVDTISNCYNTGNISATSSSSDYTCAGGIAGSNNSTISNCYNIGIVSASYLSYVTYNGGIIGDSSGTMSNCYYLNIISKGVGDGSDTSTLLTLEQIKQQTSYVGLDFTNVWNMSSYLPYLRAIPYVELNSITFKNINITLGVGGKYQISLNYNPSLPTFSNVQYTSLNTSYATVDENGVINGVAIGTANIIAKDLVTNKTAVCTVNVTKPVAEITIRGSNSVNVGGSVLFSASISPSDAGNKTISWSSSDDSIATIDLNGLATTHLGGTVTIYAISNDGTNVKGSFVLTVIQKAQSISLDINTVSLNVGQTQTLTATISPSDTTNKNISWISKNIEVATISPSGIISAISRGTSTITAKTEDGGFTATCIVIVIQPVTSVSFAQSAVNIGVGAQLKLVPIINPSNANNQNVSWASSEPYVSINSDGTITGVSIGTSVITVTTEDGGKTAMCIINVLENLPGDINGDATIDLKDVTALSRCVAGWQNLTIISTVADINRDGTIDLKDVTTLSRYVAGWGIELK